MRAVIRIGQNANRAALAAQRERDAAAESARIASATPPFAGFDPAFCAGSNPDCPQEFPEQRFPNEPRPMPFVTMSASSSPAPVVDAPVLIGIDPGAPEGDRTVYAEIPAAIETGHAPSTYAEDIAALAAEARASRFPSQPKMEPAWWARFYALADRMGDVA